MTGHGAEAQIGASQDVAKRRDDVPGLERARRGLGQERRVQQEVHVVDQDQSGRLAWHQALELTGRLCSRESTTGDDDVPGHDPSMTACNNLLQSAIPLNPPTLVWPRFVLP